MNEFLLPGFRAIEDAERARFAASEDAVYAVGEDLRIGYANEAFLRIAGESGADMGPWLGGGRDVLDACQEPVRRFYSDLYGRAYAGGVVEHDYLCPTPEQHREFRMRILPRPGGFLVVHHRRFARPHEGGCSDHAGYRGKGDVVVQCCACRTTLRSDGRAWDFVAQFVDQPPSGTQYGLCPSCFAHHYPDEPADRS